MGLLILAFEADVIATAAGFWVGRFISKYVFFILFLAVLFAVLRFILQNIITVEKAKELELQRSCLEAKKYDGSGTEGKQCGDYASQIQPYFIYNILGTIERICLKDPQKANESVRNFSLYLRGNISELDSAAPMRSAEELKHVEYSVNIEKVRFSDMTVEYDVEVTEFVLPALSIQSLVENAINTVWYVSKQAERS